MSKKFISNSVSISISHVKCCLNVLHKKHQFIEIISQFCSISGKQLANQYIVTYKGYLFLSLNKPPLKEKEIKYFSNNAFLSSFSIFILESNYKDEILQASKQYEIQNFDHIAKTKEFFSHNKINFNNKEDSIEGWIKWYHNWMINAVERINKNEQEMKIDIFEINEYDLITSKNLTEYREKGLSSSKLQETIKKFKIYHQAEYHNNPEIRKTKKQWYRDFIGWICNAIEMMNKGIKEIRITAEKYISQFKEVGKGVCEKLGEKKVKLCLDLFIKYHTGRENTLFVWNKLKEGWIERAIKNIAAKKEKQASTYKAIQEEKIRDIASKATKQEMKAIVDKALCDDKLQSIIYNMYSLPCYTETDRLGREIREEILINMDRHNQYNTDMLDMISKISIKVPVEGVLGIAVNDYYYSSNRIREKELLEISRKMVEYGIVKKYGFIQIEDRDRGEIIWKK